MKNIIFDWSGVVRDTVTGQLWIVNKIFEKYNVSKISLEEFRENWKQPPALFYQKYLPEGYSEQILRSRNPDYIVHDAQELGSVIL